MVESEENKLVFTIGTQRVFPFHYAFFEPSDIHCYVTEGNVVVELTKDQFYVEQKSDYSNGADITINISASEEAKLTIIREIPMVQGLSLPENGRLPSEPMENQFDRIVMMIQQLSEELGRKFGYLHGVDVPFDDFTEAMINSVSSSLNSANAAQNSANAAQNSANAAQNSANASAESARIAEEKIVAAFEKSAGLPIGAIFPFPASVPPEGAYLLNGQTIYDCKNLYPKFWEWLTDNANNGAIRSVTGTQYEEEIAQYGICSGFVISENDVRLPTWKGYQTPLGDSVPVVGNGMAFGLTNGSNFGSPVDAASDYNFAPNGYGVAVGSSVSPGRMGTNTAVGVTTDPEKSGLLADTSGYAKDGFHWCIQVYNAATALSEQESAQLASQMQMKAQTDFANVNDNLDFVVDSWNDGAGNWYRKYRSGWVEQGGVQSGATDMTVTLFIEFANANYAVRVTGRGPSSRGYMFGVDDLAETGFSVSCGTGTNTGVSAAFSGELEWEAKGYAK